MDYTHTWGRGRFHVSLTPKAWAIPLAITTNDLGLTISVGPLQIFVAYWIDGEDADEGKAS